jgi:hypothetical protein
MQVKMWQTITQADIEEARARLSRKREEALSRHAAEIRSLDAQLDDIESFERVVAAFFEEYMGEAVPPALAGSVAEEARGSSLAMSVAIPSDSRPEQKTAQVPAVNVPQH